MKDAVAESFAALSGSHAESIVSTSFYRTYGKRALDLVLCAILLPLTLPVIAILWMLVRLDGGAGFFGHSRVGLGGKHFRCLKLRTMVPNAERVLQDLIDNDPAIAEEWHRSQKLARDPRITTVGRFLRKTSLDELPQILNVLRGDMSFVGPRPFASDQEAMYRSHPDDWAYYLMRPGITGPWQLGARNETSFLGRVDYDRDYLKDQSFWYDLRSVFGTVRIVLRGSGQ